MFCEYKYKYNANLFIRTIIIQFCCLSSYLCNENPNQNPNIYTARISYVCTKWCRTANLQAYLILKFNNIVCKVGNVNRYYSYKQLCNASVCPPTNQHHTHKLYMCLLYVSNMCIKAHIVSNGILSARKLLCI